MPTSRIALFIGTVWPEPQSSAAGVRMMQLINRFQSTGFEVHFASSAQKSPYSADLEIQEHHIQLNSGTFDDLITQIQPAVVIFDRFMTEEQFGWRVAEHCPGAIRILDTEDLHFLRKARENWIKKNAPNYEFLVPSIDDVNIIDEPLVLRELASIYRCDLSLIISRYEMDLLTNTFQIPDQQILYLPYILEAHHFEKSRSNPDFNQRQHFVSIGNFLHPPNLDAVRVLKQSIWPQIREKLPSAELHIYGAYPSSKSDQLHNPKEGFQIKGRAENAVDTISQYKVMLSPLRFGAGLKGKFVDALLSGTPAVTSSIGAEGFSHNITGLHTTDKTQGFVDMAVDLYQNKQLWENHSTSGIHILKDMFQSLECLDLYDRKLNQLLDSVSQHRNQNIIGKMLLHHTAASTKYMSRWIEEKNK